MKLYLYIVFLLFQNINSFKYSLNNNKLKYRKEFLNRKLVISNLNNKDIPYIDNNILTNVYDHIENSEKIIGKFIVTQISTLLPKVDSVGHNVLHANNEFITTILNNHILSHEHQKFIILSSIKLAQYGDDMGSHLLQVYYDLVDKCL